MKKKQLSAVVIDNDPYSAIALESFTKENKNLIITGVCTDSTKALKLCLKIQPDVVFLDIEMPVMNGFSVLRQLSDHNLKPYIIFITAHEKYAIEAIKAGALDYLLKPIERDEFDLSICKILKHFERYSLEHRVEMLEHLVANHRRLNFKTRSGLLLINPDDILYIEADSNYSDIYYDKKKREVVSVNIGSIENLLPDQFIRINRSIIINSTYLVKISGINKKCYLIKDNEEIEFTAPEKQVTELKRFLCNGNSNY